MQELIVEPDERIVSRTDLKVIFPSVKHQTVMQSNRLKPFTLYYRI